ncbi:MAG: O-antigen ligase family protein [Armatimonadota bacterium]
MSTQQATVQPSTAAPESFLDRALFVLAVIALALAPIQLRLPTPGVPLALSEPVLLLAALLWAIRWLRVRDSRSLPPFSHWLLIIAVALGVFAAGDGPQLSAVKEAAQLFLYLIIAATIFRAVLTTPERIKVAVVALLATTSLAVGLGVVQRTLLERDFNPDRTTRVVFDHFTPRAYATIQTPMYVCSTFANWDEHGFYPSRTAYAGFLALVLPFALALLAVDRRKKVVLWISLLLLGAAVSVIAGYLVPSLLLGLLVTGSLLGGRIAQVTRIAIPAYLLLLLIVGGFNRAEVLQQPYTLTIPPAQSSDGVGHLKKFWGEQQAALNLIRHNPLFGLGAGRYQSKINEAYDLLGSVSEQRLEPDMQNGYLLTAADSGVLGLAALLALWGGYLGLAWRRARTGPAHPWAAAALGAMVVLVTMTLLTNPLIRGTMLVVVALLAIIANTATKTLDERIE